MRALGLGEKLEVGPASGRDVEKRQRRRTQSGTCNSSTTTTTSQKKIEITPTHWIGSFFAFLASRDTHHEKKVKEVGGERVRRSRERMEGREGEAAGFRWTRRW